MVSLIITIQILSKKEDCFSFDTEYEANKCLRNIFNNGE